MVHSEKDCLLKSFTLWSKLWLLAAILVLAACTAPQMTASPTPFAVARADTPMPTMTFTATFTPAATQAPMETPIPAATATPIPTETPTAIPTERPKETPTETAAEAGAATLTPTPTRLSSSASSSPPGAVPTPTVVIPQGWPVYMDARLGYSLATPSTWLRVDLRGDGFKSLARLFGSSAAGLLDQIETFLATPAGESIGIMAVEADITQFFSANPFPAFAIVTVIDLPADVTAEEISAVLAANAGLFGTVTIESSAAETINNLPAVRVIAQADLSAVGYPVTAYVEQVGLLANAKLYVLTLATKADGAARKQAFFDKIIGSFRPE